MLTFTVESPLEATPEQAVTDAIGRALADFRDLAEKVHVHVLQVVKIHGLWKAVVKVVIEPSLKPEPEEQRKDEKTKEPEPEKNLHKQPKEEEKQEYEASPSHAEPPHPAPDIHIHVPYEQEDAHPVYAALQTHHPDYYFHFLDSDSLWETSHEIYPDIDLYEAAHPMPPASITWADLEPDMEPVLEESYQLTIDQPGPALVRKPKKKSHFYELNYDLPEDS